MVIKKLSARSVEQANTALARSIIGLKGKIKTITLDNGTKFHGYKSVEDQLHVKFYCATPYHSWERGTNENTNGLLRQYLPKGTCLKDLTQADCDRIAHELNSRPRERLGFKTPAEVFNGRPRGVALQRSTQASALSCAHLADYWREAQRGGGLRGMRGALSLGIAQAWACSQNMWNCGLNHDVSSSVPALMKSHIGVAVASDSTGEPHFGQNLRTTGRVESPISWNSARGSPESASEPFGTATSMENAEPDCLWQCLQWHTPMSTGSAAVS